MDIHDDGVEILRELISPYEAKALADEVASFKMVISKYGIRNANVEFEGIAALANDPRLTELAARILGDQPCLVRAIFFDKTPDMNWLVTWHQDKSVAVDRKVDIDGWGPWSVKAGVHHVQPPLEVLNSMVTFRIHLDAADETNGCLRVIPGSHALGIIDSREVSNIVKDANPNFS